MKKLPVSNSELLSKRQKVFALLDKNPMLTAKLTAKLLGFPYPKSKQYLDNLKQLWKTTHENERGSNCSLRDVHCWRAFVDELPCVVDRVVAVERAGWLRTASRNRYLLFKNRLGRLMWFETGRVNLYVRKPATLGKAMQLFADGFFNTGLVSDIKVLETVKAKLKFKSAHFVFGHFPDKLPKARINLFGDSNGIEIRLGDRSHPHDVEVIAGYMNWAERFERITETFATFMDRLTPPSAPETPKLGKADYVT